MDVYVAAIRCGQSEEVACRAALAAEKRRFEEMWRRETEHWTRRLIDIESRKPPQPIITPKPPGQ
jgi:hypothetical protein